jgi:methylase of polypeptide subunit release factors
MTNELTWKENNQTVTRNWVTESNFSLPKKILPADDRLKASDFYRQASEGAAFIYKGDFQNAKQLLQAVQRRIDQSIRKKPNGKSLSLRELFHRHRQSQAHRAKLLSRLLICVESDYKINLSRAPDVRQAITEALEPVSKGESPSAFVVSLRELLGYIGAHEWRKKGVFIAALDDKIHPHYGIFSPVRGEHLDLINQAPLPAGLTCAFDIGTGTGVIAAILAKRGVKRIIATDLDPRAMACARENISCLGYTNQVEVINADLFPPGRAELIVCNPPWVPARPTSRIEYAVYDENSQVLKRFLNGMRQHLADEGEAWLILSDLAEHLGLREPFEVESLITEAGLTIIECLTTRAKHAKALDEDDPLHLARSKEVTKLFRLNLTAASQ